ncbi:hypothetical protein [Streptosporangium vulgare]|uniref:Uncharacterized protein n=1 Tax=Streptosporangium vulgare TaxID=46190 RepID=A0ABV5TIN8_9ACTN
MSGRDSGSLGPWSGFAVYLVWVAVPVITGFHGVFWFAVAMLVVVLAAVPLLPRREEAPHRVGVPA